MRERGLRRYGRRWLKTPCAVRRVRWKGEGAEGAPRAGHGSEATMKTLGEIIAADTFQFEAECLRLYGSPEFGSFVRADGGGGRIVYGVVYYILTAAAEANRRTHALRMTPEELKEQMPQLELVLRTTFAALIIGHAEKRSDSRSLRPVRLVPPQPPEIHRFVEPATPEETRALTEGPDFLRTLTQTPPRGYPVPMDDLIAAAILQAASARGAGSTEAEQFVVECGKHLAPLLKNEFGRFEAIMRRLEAARTATGPHYEQPLL